MADATGDTPGADPKAGTTPPATDTPPQTTTPPAAGAKVEQPVEIEQLKNELNRKDAVAKAAQTAEAEAKRIARSEKVERIRLEKQLKAIQKDGSVIPPVDTSSSSDSEQQIQLKTQLMIRDLLIDNQQYRELVDSDPTLKEVVRNNPFVLIGDYFDANDAVEQFRERLDKILDSKKPASPPAPKAEEPPIIETKTVQPPTGAVAPASDANKGFPSGNDSVADSISKKINFV